MAGRHIPTQKTRAQVEALAAFGIPQPDIAAMFEITEKTLRKHYRVELDYGGVKANAKVAQNLFAFASGSKGTEKGQVTAAIFWAKTRMGWRETVDLNHSGQIDVAGAGQRLAGKLARAVAAGGAGAVHSRAH
jgi:hypothetical protein